MQQDRSHGAASNDGGRSGSSGTAGDQRRTSSGDALQRDPDEWATGDEPMTAAQASYLRTLATEAGETVDENLTKAEASKRIDELQRKTGRGR